MLSRDRNEMKDQATQRKLGSSRFQAEKSNYEQPEMGTSLTFSGNNTKTSEGGGNCRSEKRLEPDCAGRVSKVC